MKIKANLILPSSKELAKITGLDKGGKVQQYIDSFVFYHSEPYLPGKHIHNQSVAANNFGSGKVIWNTPDANYLYEGKLMVDALTHSAWGRPNQPKIMDPQNRDLHYHGGGLREDHWFDRMISTEMNELVKGVKNIANGGKQ